MQPVRACPVEVDDSLFAELSDGKKGATMPDPISPIHSGPVGEPEGEPGCGDAGPGKVSRKPALLLDVDGKTQSVCCGSCWRKCLKRAGMCMMVLSAVGLNLTAFIALSESWKTPPTPTPTPKGTKALRGAVKLHLPVEPGTSIGKVSSKLTPMNSAPTKAPKAESKQAATKSADAESAKTDKAPKVASVKQDKNQKKQKKKSAEPAASSNFASSPADAGLGLGDEDVSSRSKSNDDQDGDFLIKMMADEDDDAENTDDENKDSTETQEDKEREKLQDMLHEAEEAEGLHKGSLLKPEITPEPQAHPSLNSHARLQTPEDGPNEGGVIARWENAQSEDQPVAQREAMPLWEAARMQLPKNLLSSFR